MDDYTAIQAMLALVWSPKHPEILKVYWPLQTSTIFPTLGICVKGDTQPSRKIQIHDLNVLEAAYHGNYQPLVDYCAKELKRQLGID